MSDVLQHETVLCEQAVDVLKVRADGVYVDATFGRGGHSALILRQLGVAGRLIALDRDPQAVAVGEQWQDKRFVMCHANFSELAVVLGRMGVAQVDGVLMDLGVSSPQLDDAGRGFSFRHDAPLDMRMDTTAGETAAQWLAHAGEQELKEVIWRYGEERYAGPIARAIVEKRVRQPIVGTGELARLVASVVPGREVGKDPATRTFQAIRIHVNGELEALASGLAQAADALLPRGRLVVIAFHSLEDRMVKRFMRERSSAPQLPWRLPVRAVDIPAPRMRLVGRAMRADEAEVARNPRARSAIMRVLEAM